jgi:hypothetical protein
MGPHCNPSGEEYNWDLCIYEQFLSAYEHCIENYHVCVLNRAALSKHESLPNFCYYTQSKRYEKIMLPIFKDPRF